MLAVIIVIIITDTLHKPTIIYRVSFPGLSPELFDQYLFIIGMLLPTHSFYQNSPYLLRQ